MGITRTGIRGKSSGIREARGLRENLELKMRRSPTKRKKIATIDQAHNGDEFFQLDSLSAFCKSESVELVRLPRCTVRQELRSSSVEQSSPSVESAVH
jgi:hypothetical protein